jgi:hypothetical protein
LKSISKDTKVLFYFFLVLLIIWIIFDALKYSWTDDPFQKVILAPLGEEPFKILMGLLFCIYTYYLLKLYRAKKKTKQKIYFVDVFYYTIIPFSIVVAIWFGIAEGHLNNILFHFSSTLIATILIITFFHKVKDKKWKTHWKVIALLSTLSIPMLLHSIQNQYANITYADNHPKFDYLVIIGRFLEKNTFLSTQGRFTLLIFYVTLVVFLYFIYKYLKSKKDSTD